MLTDQLSSLWSDSLTDVDFRFELKAQAVAVELAEAFAKTGMSQQELADRLGWKKSRVSKVLHGASNLTLKTLFQICESMGGDFKVVFEDSAANTVKHSKYSSNPVVMSMRAQSEEVFRHSWHDELVAGNDDVYPQRGRVVRSIVESESAYG